MKRFILLFLFISTFQVSAQKVKILQDAIFIEYGKSISSFDYTNSLGLNLENLKPMTKNYFRVGYNHDWYFSNKSVLQANRFSFSVSLDYNNYGAQGSNDILYNIYEWDLEYLGLNLAINYDLIKMRDFTIYITGGTSSDYNLRGTQMINNQIYSLENVEEFDPFTFFFKGGAGVTYPISEKARVYVQYLYSSSNVLKDDSPSSLEQLSIRNHSVGAGILVEIKGFKKTNIDIQ